MDTTKQQIAIAEACGWRIIDFTKDVKFPERIPPKTTYWDTARKYKPYPGLPDYLNDLNAMQLARATLGERDKGAYWDHLHEIVCGHTFWGDDATSWKCFDAMDATSSQHAEAFLRTLALWTES